MGAMVALSAALLVRVAVKVITRVVALAAVLNARLRPNVHEVGVEVKASSEKYDEHLQRCANVGLMPKLLLNVLQRQGESSLKEFLVVFPSESCLVGELLVEIAEKGFKFGLNALHVLLEVLLRSVAVLQWLALGRSAIGVSGVVHATDDAIEPSNQNGLAESLLLIVEDGLVHVFHSVDGSLGKAQCYLMSSARSL